MNRTGLIDFLTRTSSYPHSPEKVVHTETHASDVFIVSPLVYKVKKPVDFGFLDFSTLEKRKHFLELELVLNKRLTDGIYLEVKEISLKSGEYVFGPGDETVEYALIMKELPKEYFLKNLLTEGRISEGDFDKIALKLAGFYKSEKTDEQISACGDPERIKPDVYENITSSWEYIGKTVTEPALSAIKLYNDLYFEKKSELLKQRASAGFIKECHGDLHLEHINLSPGGINIYDCIEFNERFRYIDIASDAAFLAMDLDYNGYPELGRYFISRISELMDDKGIYGVLDFYKCYRALVRAKVLSLMAFEPEVPGDSKQKCISEAKRYYSLALRYALLGSRPSLIAVFGSIGTGKSTLSKTLSEELSCSLLSSDVTRKEMSGVAFEERHYEPYESGIYSEEKTQEVYTELIKRAIEVVGSSGCAVIEASFSKKRWRELLKRSALDRGINLYFIQTLAPLVSVRERLRRRELKGVSISDGRLEILEQFCLEFEEPEELTNEALIKVDTEVSKEEKFKDVLSRLAGLNIETDYEF